MRRNVYLLILLITQLPAFYSCQSDSNSRGLQVEGASDQLSIATKEFIDSKILGEQREVWVHVPAEFYGMDTTDVKFPVIYLVDADGHFLPLVGIVDQLSSRFSANDQAPPHIVVGIRNPNRNLDLSPPHKDVSQDSIRGTGGANNFARFISDELMPLINEKYPVAPYTTMAGHSLGGLFVLNTLIENQDLFNNYLAIDPAMDWDDRNFLNRAINAFKTKTFNDKQVYIVGAGPFTKGKTVEEIKNDTSMMMGLPSAVLTFRDEIGNVNRPGLNLKFEMEMDENHFTVPLLGFPNALKYFYDGHNYDKMGNYYDKESPQREKDIVLELDQHYKKLSERMGYELKPLESYVNAWAMGFGYNGETKFGEQLYDYNIAIYPRSPFVHAANGYFKLFHNDTIAAIASFENSLKLSEDEELVGLLKELKLD